MIVTLQDREILKAIVTEAVAEAMAVKITPEQREAAKAKLVEAMEYRRQAEALGSSLPSLAVLETKPPETISLDDLVVKVRGYRGKAKHLAKTLEKFRNHQFESKNASKAIENARNDVDEARDDLVAFAKRIGDGSITVDWD